MPVPVLAIAAGVKAGGALASFLGSKKNRTPRFENTAEGRMLYDRSKRGAYASGRRRAVVSAVGRRAGEAAYQSRQDTKGYLTARGMEKSIAGAKLLDDPNRQRLNAMAGASERINMANEDSKVVAEEQYARGVNQYAAARRAEDTQRRQALIGGLTDAALTGTQAYGNYLQQKGALAKAAEMDVPEDIMSMDQKQIIDWAARYPDPARSEKIVNLWMLQHGMGTMVADN